MFIPITHVITSRSEQKEEEGSHGNRGGDAVAPSCFLSCVSAGSKRREGKGREEKKSHGDHSALRDIDDMYVCM